METDNLADDLVDDLVDKLLGEFPPVSTEAWENAIHADLKGAGYARKLIWQSAEGLAVKPYYRAEDIVELRLPDAAPNAFPYLRSVRPTGDWRIREEIDAADPKQANRAALAAVAAGAGEISFLNVILRNSSDLRMLLANLTAIPVHFENAGEPLIRLLLEQSKDTREAPTISTGWNPLEDLDFAACVLRTAPSALIPVTLHGERLEESGATAVEEVGFMLAAGIDFLREMQSRDIAIDRAAPSITFSFSVGSSFFFQIAKFRAFHMVWAKAVESFGSDRESGRAKINARTSRWNKTIYDPHVNILRATTEAMSAAFGGADSICVAPFEECYKTPGDASRRLARNTQIVLKQEALLSRVADPAAGSYCLEAITDFLAREGWKSMQKIEAAGGYRKACAEGLLDVILQDRMATRERSVISRQRVFTGTNQFADPAEKALNRIEPLHTSGQRRGAQIFERLRLRTERHTALTGKLPRILLAEFGDVKMRSARSNFAANFFACAGFEIATRLFESADEIAASEAEVIVLCSSDHEYLKIAACLAQKLKTLGRETPVIVAGNPESAEQLRAAGIADFIHLRSNPIEVLTDWQQRLGIRA